MKIVVTIPAYNEEKTIGRLIREVHKVMREHKYNYKILVVNDGSKDRTQEIAKKENAVLYSHPKNYGLAETFKTEINKALELKADIIVHIDADLQYLPEEIPKLIKWVNKGYDLVLGSRFKGKIESMPLIKRTGNRLFSFVVSNITGTKITDAQTGFRAFTRDIAGNINIISNHTYTQEQLMHAIKGKYRIKEVPIYFAKRNGKSRLISNPFEYALRAWINIIRIYRDYKPLQFFGLLGGIIFSAGFMLGLYLVYVQFYEEGVFRHFGLMMLDILTLSIGLQIIIFGFLADMLRK